MSIQKIVLDKMKNIIGDDESSDNVEQFCLMSILSSDFQVKLTSSQTQKMFEILTEDQFQLILSQLKKSKGKWY